jgi:hypothetical protein
LGWQPEKRDGILAEGFLGMQFTTTGALSGNRQVKAAVIGLVVLAVIWELAAWIVAGSDKNLVMFGLSLVMVALVVHILNDWRSGVLVFLVWLLFEDLARKYLGNSMTVYFAKDILVAVAYFSFYFAKRRKEVEILNKIPFIVPLAMFIGLAFVEIFNPFSPNVLYGLLGLKLYFYYVPLMFLGFAMLRRPADLDRLVKVSLLAGILISGLGIAQSVLGVSFLTPEDMDSDIYALSHVVRYSPITHQAAFAPSSVFVSAGRFSTYLILVWILAFGAQGYFLLARKSEAKYGFWGLGVVTVAVMITGTRTPFVFVVGSAFVMTAAFLWGAPWRWGQGHRMVKALRRGFLVGGVGLILMFEVFPTAIGGSWAFISETLTQGNGTASDLSTRGWDYPVQNLMGAFEEGDLLIGHGTGMSSLGMQYVSRVLGEQAPIIGVESGFGTLIVEMGIFGPLLWIAWASVLLWQGWGIVRRLRQTVYFPLGFAIWWYGVLVLFMFMYLTMAIYQNFVNNAYLWLLIGVLFRLPKLAEMPQPVPIPRHLRSVPRWRLAMVGR